METTATVEVERTAETQTGTRKKYIKRNAKIIHGISSTKTMAKLDSNYK